MNIQSDTGIGWTKVPRWNEEKDEMVSLPGATWNPTAGCFHGCTWTMPDGSIAGCYAKRVAEKLATKSYPHGFAHHYWHPARLEEPFNQKRPHGIFVGSMADLFGAWVPAEQIQAVIDMMAKCHWHTFLILTKNPKRLIDFSPFPINVWVGMSLPTDDPRKERGTAIYEQLHSMNFVQATVRFLSAEPLWQDVAGALESWHLPQRRPLPFDWIIIGAMTKGPKVYRTNFAWIVNMISLTRDLKIWLYMKRNLQIEDRLTEFPLVLLPE